MKRTILLLVGIIAITFMTTSCLKTRICECRSTTIESANQNYTVGPGSQTNAQAECENYQFDGRSSYSTSDYTCTLQ